MRCIPTHLKVRCGDASLLLLSLLLLFVYFFTLSSLLQFILYAFYTCLCVFFISVATESKRCGLVQSLA